MLPDLNLQRFDGIALRVKGDGQTYKFNLKTADQMNVPESTYQAQFDTIDGEWTTAFMPWHEFVPVTRAQYDAKAKPLNPADVKQLGLVLSRFYYNSLPNQRHKPGNFELQVHLQSCLSQLLVWIVAGEWVCVLLHLIFKPCVIAALSHGCYFVARCKCLVTGYAAETAAEHPCQIDSAQCCSHMVHPVNIIAAA